MVQGNLSAVKKETAALRTEIYTVKYLLYTINITANIMAYLVKKSLSREKFFTIYIFVDNLT